MSSILVVTLHFLFIPKVSERQIAIRRNIYAQGVAKLLLLFLMLFLIFHDGQKFDLEKNFFHPSFQTYSYL